jgi:hypothetical protein
MVLIIKFVMDGRATYFGVRGSHSLLRAVNLFWTRNMAPGVGIKYIITGGESWSTPPDPTQDGADVDSTLADLGMEDDGIVWVVQLGQTAPLLPCAVPWEE